MASKAKTGRARKRPRIVDNIEIVGDYGLASSEENPADLAFDEAMDEAISAARATRPDDPAHQAAMDYVAGEVHEPLRQAGLEPAEIVEVLARKYHKARLVVSNATEEMQKILKGGR